MIIEECPDPEKSSGFYYDIPMMSEEYVEWWMKQSMYLLALAPNSPRVQKIQEAIRKAYDDYASFLAVGITDSRKSLNSKDQLSFDF